MIPWMIIFKGIAYAALVPSQEPIYQGPIWPCLIPGDFLPRGLPKPDSGRSGRSRSALKASDDDLAELGIGGRPSNHNDYIY